MSVLNRLSRVAKRIAKFFASTRSLGDKGELLAQRHLKRIGYIVIARSQRDRLGEVDLIAVDGSTVVFVEVKTRSSDVRGAPADAVDKTKQDKLTRLALRYLKRHDLLEHPARFDVIAITWPMAAKRKVKPRLQHFKGAFESSHKWQMYG